MNQPKYMSQNYKTQKKTVINPSDLELGNGFKI